MALPAIIAAGSALVRMIGTRIPKDVWVKIMQHMSRGAGVAWETVKKTDVVSFLAKLYGSVNSVGKLVILLFKAMLAYQLFELVLDAYDLVLPYIEPAEVPAVQRVLLESGVDVVNRTATPSKALLPQGNVGKPPTIDVTPVGAAPSYSGQSGAVSLDLARFDEQSNALSGAIAACGSLRNFLALREALVVCDDQFLAVYRRVHRGR